MSRIVRNSAGTDLRLRNLILGIFITVYSLLTLFPFYLLFVRTFVSTVDSTEPHLWIPKAREFNMDGRFGNMAVFYNLDIGDFKKKMRIKGYLNPNISFRQIAAQYNVPEEKILAYMEPFYVYNGWFTILRGGGFAPALLRSAYLTAGAVLIGGFLSSCTGFVLAGFRKKWHFYAYNIYMMRIIIPPVMIMIPQFIIARQLHLYNSIWGLIFFHIKGGALATMLFTSYIAKIPSSFRESVEIDGGGHFRYFFHILLPLCRIPFASLMAIQIPWFWNDLLYPILFLKPDKYTLIPWINSFVGGGQLATNFQAIYTGLFLSLIPLLVIYLLFQNLFIRSALAGGVKE